MLPNICVRRMSAETNMNRHRPNLEIQGLTPEMIPETPNVNARGLTPFTTDPIYVDRRDHLTNTKK